MPTHDAMGLIKTKKTLGAFSISAVGGIKEPCF